LNRSRDLIKRTIGFRIGIGPELSDFQFVKPIPLELEAQGRKKLKQARERAGIHVDDVYQFVGNSRSAYYDLENCDGDLFMAINLGDLVDVCAKLGLTVRQLFDDGPTQDTVPLGELTNMILDHIDQQKLTIDEFEEAVNYEMRNIFEDPNEIACWNLDLFKNVCDEIGVRWLDALPA